jgi:hypothetical protein
MEGQVQKQPLSLLVPLTDIAARALVAVAAAITLLFAAAIAYVAIYDAPYWDLWQHINLEDVPNSLFDRNNEHPIVTGRLLFWLDEVLFSGTSRFVQAVSLVLLAVQVAAFVWLARMVGVNRQLLVVGAVSTVLVFYTFGFENTIWIFQAPMVLAFTSAVGGFVCFASFALHGSRVSLAGSIVFSILSILSFANGVLVPTMLGATAAWLRRPKAAIVFGAIALLAWIWQFGAGGGDVREAPGLVIGHHFLAQLGGPIGWAWGYLWKLGGPSVDSMFAATIAGTIALLLALLALAYVALKRRRDPAALAAAAIIMFSLATAALVTLARSHMGPEQAMSSRYNINAAILYSAVFVLLLASLPEWPAALRRALVWVGPVLGIALLIMSATTAPMLQDLAGRYRAGLAGAVSLVAGARDEAAVGQLYFNHDFAVEQTAVFRRKGTWMFADPIARRMGEMLSGEERSAPPCAGSSWTVTTPDEGHQYRQADGRLARQTLSSGAFHVLIADPSGLIVGYGRVPRRASDLNPFARNDGRPIDWIGRVRPSQELPLTAWLGDGSKVRCALGSTTG